MSRWTDLVGAARTLAWLPTANLPGGPVYRDRKDAHDRLVDALAALPATNRATRRIEAGYLLRAAWRVGAATFSNRLGEPYYERREAVAQLRGAIDVYDKAVELQRMVIIVEMGV